MISLVILYFLLFAFFYSCKLLLSRLMVKTFTECPDEFSAQVIRVIGLSLGSVSAKSFLGFIEQIFKNKFLSIRSKEFAFSIAHLPFVFSGLLTILITFSISWIGFLNIQLFEPESAWAFFLASNQFSAYVFVFCVGILISTLSRSALLNFILAVNLLYLFSIPTISAFVFILSAVFAEYLETWFRNKEFRSLLLLKFGVFLFLSGLILVLAPVLIVNFTAYIGNGFLPFVRLMQLLFLLFVFLIVDSFLSAVVFHFNYHFRPKSVDTN